MGKLFATWQRSADVDLCDERDPWKLLLRARDALGGIPELEAAVDLVDGALEEIGAWAVQPIKPAGGLLKRVP
jgi:hypothetical protein